MTSDNVFGSHELTPELLRAATFQEVDGRIDAAEVHTFLDRVASSLEVYMSEDARTALRAEFDRNAAIATQILDAGQTASEELRREAAEQAKRILDEARDATLGLRETVETEIAEARTQVETMRGAFIQDLRDLYDRIGASLYRFERAAEESRFEPIEEPRRPAGEATSSAPTPAASAPPAPASEPAPAEPAPLPELPEGAKPPAWQQLPAEAWQSGPDTSGGDEPVATSDPAPVPAPAPAPAPEALAAEVPAVDESASVAEPAAAAAPAPEVDPFAPVVEDEPLAPGEPLVDLRNFGSTVEQADTVPAPEPAASSEPAADSGGSWLDPADDLPPVAPQAAAPDPAPVAEPALVADGGSWLDTPLDPDPDAGQPADPALARDDALAQALIGGDEQSADVASAADQPADPVAAPPVGELPVAPAPMDVPSASASPDAVAVRQLILDSLAAGQTREQVEAYLREHMGLLEPGALVDAALGSVDQP